MDIAFMPIYNISSAPFGPKNAMKAILDLKMCETDLANTIIPIQLYFKQNTVTVNLLIH